MELHNVKAYYRQLVGSTHRVVRAVDGVGMTISEGEIIGIVGESGCGKSTLANVIMMNIRPPLTLVDGIVKLYSEGREAVDLHRLSREELRRRIWGKEVAIIPQAALNALMPTLKIKKIILDVMKSHDPDVDEDYAINTAVRRFRELGLPEYTVNMYPFELSGGMRQRVVISIATLLNPRLLIADEPTSALDVVTQKMVLKILMDIYSKNIIRSIVFISHDIATVRQIASRIVIMYAGKIVEEGSTEDVITHPLHPYTDGLMNSVLTPEDEVKRRGVRFIPGQPPDPSNPPPGCRFHPRCPYAMDRCRREEPRMVQIDGNRLVACWLYTSK